MKLKAEIELQFKEELRALLKKYNAELTIEERQFRSGPFMEVYVSAEYDGTGEMISEGCAIDLGQYFSGE